MGPCTTAQNTEISPNFVVWKFCGKEQFSQTMLLHKIKKNYAFTQNFHIAKLGEISMFY